MWRCGNEVFWMQTQQVGTILLGISNFIKIYKWCLASWIYKSMNEVLRSCIACCPCNSIGLYSHLNINAIRTCSWEQRDSYNKLCAWTCSDYNELFRKSCENNLQGASVYGKLQFSCTECEQLLNSLLGWTVWLKELFLLDR